MNTQLNPFHILALFFVIVGSNYIVADEEKISTTKTNIYNQQIQNLPTSVQFTVGEDDKCVVMIQGVDPTPIQAQSLPGSPLNLFQTPMDNLSSITGVINFEMDHEKQKCSITTSHDLDHAKLVTMIDEIAQIRSDFPCWAELLSRDLKRSVNYSDNHYAPKIMDIKPPSGLAWFWIVGKRSFSTSFDLKLGAPTGRLLVISNTVPLGAQRRYTIHILDQDDRILWSDRTTLSGHYIRVALSDSDDDGRHELYIESHDGESEKLFQIKPENK